MLSAIGQVTSPNPQASALYQALDTAQKRAKQQFKPQLVSITLPTPSLDLLQIFSHINQDQSLSFYWEKRDRNCAMVAIDSAIQTTVTGPDRFQSARDWIQHHSQRLVTVDPAGDAVQARFLCGFPFLDDGPAATVFLPRWQITTHQGDRPRTIALLNCTINPHDSVDELWQRYQHQLEKIQTWGGDRDSFSPYAPLPLPHRQSWKIPDLRNDLGDGQGFIDGVERAIADIQAGYLRKVVLSHVLDLRLSVATHPASLLHNLRQRYPNCYTFAFGTGTGETFLGASPECLVRIQRHKELPQQPRTLYTEALAGSAPRGRTRLEDQRLGDRLLRSTKECHEHRLVADFIAERLHQLGIQTQAPPDPQLRKLANIQHLHAPISGPFPPHLSPLDGVAALHPTPAVAGTPRPEAINRIAQYESFDRGFYAGPIGWVDRQGLGEFAVGIRSALLCGDRARLYAGAGIVEGSDPHRELAEVRLKLQALLAALV